MISKLTVVLVASLVAISSAACGGPIQCCKQVMDSGSPSFSGLVSNFDINPSDFNGQVGYECTPLSGGECKGQKVCCSGQRNDGLFQLACIPSIIA